MKVISIETSCDETGISVVDIKENKDNYAFNIIANELNSQIDLHKEYGGVYPDLAKREHAKALPLLLVKSLRTTGIYKEKKILIEEEKQNQVYEMLSREPELAADIMDLLSNIERPKIDAIAVTSGPGLPPALWMGVNFAKALSIIWDIPVIPINHMEGHILASLLESRGGSDNYTMVTPKYPALALLISGGHTELVRFSEISKYELIGETHDDAIGEAFDKVARMLGLPYPGGPEISRLAEYARKSQTIVRDEFRLPRPMLHSGDLNFSFSGLKTAVANIVKKVENIESNMRLELALEFENSVTDVVVKKCEKAIYEYNAKSLIVGGGVSANTHIKSQLSLLCNEEGVDMYYPGAGLSTDNSIMIAIAAYNKKPKALNDIRADGNWSVTKL